MFLGSAWKDESHVDVAEERRGIELAVQMAIRKNLRRGKEQHLRKQGGVTFQMRTSYPKRKIINFVCAIVHVHDYIALLDTFFFPARREGGWIRLVQ